MPQKREKSSGRKLAITILLGVFIAIMLTIFVNLLVSYVYAGPEYGKFCNTTSSVEPYTAKIGQSCYNCTFSPQLQAQDENCSASSGVSVFEYDSKGCPVALKKCDTCSTDFDKASKIYNRKVFFVYAIIGFALIVYGLFAATLLLEIVSLPSGAFLVIEAATKNFDDKLFVIITFGLLIIAALYLALRKFKLK